MFFVSFEKVIKISNKPCFDGEIKISFNNLGGLLLKPQTFDKLKERNVLNNYRLPYIWNFMYKFKQMTSF